MSRIVETYPDTAALVAAAGDRLTGAVVSAIRTRGNALIALTGGDTGVAVLKHVGEHGAKIDWSKVHLFWGDERYVPEDDERNDKQAREALLDHIDVSATNVHAMAPATGSSATTWTPRRWRMSMCWPLTNADFRG